MHGVTVHGDEVVSAKPRQPRLGQSTRYAPCCGHAEGVDCQKSLSPQPHTPSRTHCRMRKIENCRRLADESDAVESAASSSATTPAPDAKSKRGYAFGGLPTWRSSFHAALACVPLSLAVTPSPPPSLSLTAAQPKAGSKTWQGAGLASHDAHAGGHAGERRRPQDARLCLQFPCATAGGQQPPRRSLPAAAGGEGRRQSGTRGR